MGSKKSEKKSKSEADGSSVGEQKSEKSAEKPAEKPKLKPLKKTGSVQLKPMTIPHKIDAPAPVSVKPAAQPLKIKMPSELSKQLETEEKLPPAPQPALQRSPKPWRNKIKEPETPVPQPTQVHSKPKFKQVIATKAPPVNMLNKLSLRTEVKDIFDEVSNEEESESSQAHGELHIDGLKMRLLGHQCVGVRFLSRRERAKRYGRGGLLADDMGLGKTIQSIALILKNKPEKGSPRTTLVVTPLAVMEQWHEEINRMAPSLKVMTHHGPHRAKSAEAFEGKDVVITTYDVVTSEHRDPERSPLMQTTFFRVIADEAHHFRNPRTRVCEAMLSLSTEQNARRWALTGTPLHNSLSDLGTLLHFAGVPLKQEGLPIDISTLLPDQLPQLRVILRNVMLRRSQRVLSGVLPPMEKEEVGVQLSETEWAVYNRYLKSDGKVFAKLVRLRQCCDGLLSTTGEAPVSTDIPEKSVSANGSADESDLLADLMGSLKLDRLEEEKYYGHANTKVQRLRELLMENRSRKTVVFSSFVTMLRTCEPMLTHCGLNYRVYDGSLSNDQRVKILNDFKRPESGITVLLCSLQTAAVGLNLTAASQVVMLEPWWNPQISDQAIKRVHRLGQKEKVRCVEMFAVGAVDERMLEIQDMKRQLARDMLETNEKLSSEDFEYILYGKKQKSM